MTVQHELKTHPQEFQAVLNGLKTFEVRKNDRGFNVGDELRLIEYNQETKRYGSYCIRSIKYIMHGPKFGVEKGYCAMSIF